MVLKCFFLNYCFVFFWFCLFLLLWVLYFQFIEGAARSESFETAGFVEVFCIYLHFFFLLGQRGFERSGSNLMFRWQAWSFFFFVLLIKDMWMMLYILECFVCILSARPIFSDQLDVFIQIKVNVLVKSP